MDWTSASGIFRPPALPRLYLPSTELADDFSWLSMEQQLQIMGDLYSDHQPGLESAVGPGSQVEYYPTHHDATVTPLFSDADFAEWVKETNDAKATDQTNSNDEIKSYIKRSKLEAFVLTLGAWGGQGQRKCHMRRTSWKDISYMIGFEKPFARGGWKKTRKSKLHRSTDEVESRKNNPHWTAAEVKLLVDGLSTYGVGRWTDIKNAYFKTSIRTPMHLKDKWKNLTEGSGPEVRSKKKVKPHKATQKILQRLKDQIIKIDRARAAHERRA
ncbi:hypothetical protein EJB05_22175 [Eragrostis curvula]|uniref:Uncharacterized protein n=1 Tax=Eragrostis curvula TaxID=38414 RepID=A0A5J9V3Q0_9POAL|nr:hypothetical protein EJB05_22175 [Eragrostis curvula]